MYTTIMLHFKNRVSQCELDSVFFQNLKWTFTLNYYLFYLILKKIPVYRFKKKKNDQIYRSLSDFEICI